MLRVVARGGELSPDDSDRIASVARSGGAIVFPTETFYALGADPLSAPALAGLFRLKGRPAAQPLLLLLDSVAGVERFAAGATGAHRALMERYWPGPLTLLFPARDGLPDGIVSAGGEVALRVPGSAVARAVAAAAGGALTGTSANRTGQPPPSSPRQALASLGGGVDLVVDAGTLPPAVVSTVLRLAEGKAAVLREGAVGLSEMEKFLEETKRRARG